MKTKELKKLEKKTKGNYKNLEKNPVKKYNRELVKKEKEKGRNKKKQNRELKIKQKQAKKIGESVGN